MIHKPNLRECCEQDILLLNIIIWWYVFIGLQVAQASNKTPRDYVVASNILVVIKDYESAFDAVTLIQIP